jgi:hypothetical protein
MLKRGAGSFLRTVQISSAFYQYPSDLNVPIVNRAFQWAPIVMFARDIGVGTKI